MFQETCFSIKHSNYRPYVLDQNVISARRQISNTGHDFNKHGKFTLTQAIQNINKPTKVLKNTNNTNGKTFRLKTYKHYNNMA